MLFYPPYHMRVRKCSNNIFYTAPFRNQQAEAAVQWLMDPTASPRQEVSWWVSDYVYPRTANTIIKEQMKALWW